MSTKNRIHLMERMKPVPINGGFRMEGYWVWCGSVIKGEDGRYHMFASRWPKTQPMHPGWLLQSEVVRAVSDTPSGPYEFQEVVLPARGAEYWDGRITHNPHIMKDKDTYILYYIGSTHPFPDITENETLVHEDLSVITARANKRIGIAVSDSVFGPWKRYNQPILQTRPEHPDSLLTSNPAPCFREDGSVVMVYKARAYKKPPYVGELHGPMTLGVAEAAAFNSTYRVTKDILFPDDICIEDPFIWREGSHFQMIAKDMYGNICGEQYGGIHAWSSDGINWTMCKGELAYTRNVVWEDGKKETLGNMDRPFILFEDGIPTHIFFAVSNGTDSFLDATETWNIGIPLE